MGAQYSTFHAAEPPHRLRAISNGSDRAGNITPHNKRKRACSEENWDFFVPLDEHNDPVNNPSNDSGVTNSGGPLTWASPETHPPVYILEATLSEQELWHATAGKRPVQPPAERKYYEELYRDNFKQSEALQGDGNIFDDSSIERASRMRRETGEEVLFRGKGPFSYAVSKSFLYCRPPAMTLQIPRFEIRRDRAGWCHAEFLVVVSVNRLTLGIWRRYSQFKKLAQQVRALNKTDLHYNEYNNSILSWDCLTNRQRMFRCLEKDYVALKCFLLERFLHDLLFESPNPAMLVEFLGLN